MHDLEVNEDDSQSMDDSVRNAGLTFRSSEAKIVTKPAVAVL